MQPGGTIYEPTSAVSCWMVGISPKSTWKVIDRLRGIVEQDVFLFDGTVGENIGYSRCVRVRRRIREAVSHCPCGELNDFQNGYDTLIGERGVKLSGGQRQRIATLRGRCWWTPEYSFSTKPPAIWTVKANG
ncbi:MAG: hypothetical protein R3C12_20360 [Planctomycetaceae bacterium]